MATRKKAAASINVSRLKILAAGDETPYREAILELLALGERLAREAALESLLTRALPIQDVLRRLYLELDADGSKADQGCPQRSAIVQVLSSVGDTRDVAIALKACDTFEAVLKEDVSWRLRTYGLRMLAQVAPDLFAYIGAEHLNDRDESVGRTDPANTVIQLLAATGRHAQVYQWLQAGPRPPEQVAAAFEVLTGAPAEVVERYATEMIRVALKTENDRLALTVAEAIIERDMSSLYPSLDGLLTIKISDELYSYLAVLMAGTNRADLLAILERQLFSGRRPRLVIDALRVRTTQEQQAIIDAWERDHG